MRYRPSRCLQRSWICSHLSRLPCRISHLCCPRPILATSSSLGPIRTPYLLGERSVSISIFPFITLYLTLDPVFIYSCPSGSPIKYRMLYASGALMIQRGAQAILNDASTKSHIATRKIETSDPGTIDEALLVSELDLVSTRTSSDIVGATPNPPPTTTFAKPRGPPRRPR